MCFLGVSEFYLGSVFYRILLKVNKVFTGVGKFDWESINVL